jgi:soluble lytic murein transglycosylase-like protein
VSVFAGFAAVAFAAAYVGPMGAALAETDPEVASTSLFASAADEAQSFVPMSEVESGPVALNRDGYTVYVKPKPTPTPKPQPTVPQIIAGPPPYSGGGTPAEWMAAAGIAEADYGYVDYIVGRESGWNPNATNSSSGACGLVQVYPCGKLANAYDPVTNLQWANGYATGRYGSWAGAYNFWITNHWW